MKRKNVARGVGLVVFLLTYGAMTFLIPLVPEGTWVALVALFFAAWAADQIDPVNHDRH